MPDVWLGRFSRYTEKLFNAKGGPVLIDVLPSVTPVMQMTNPPIEERYLVGMASFGAGRTQAAVAANDSAAMIRNPTGSNALICIEKVTAASTVVTECILAVAGSNPADLGTTISNTSRADPRGPTTSVALVTMGAPAVDPATGFLQIADYIIGTTSFELISTSNQEIVLLPGIALRLIMRTPNLNLTWTFFWRERPLEQSELT